MPGLRNHRTLRVQRTARRPNTIDQARPKTTGRTPVKRRHRLPRRLGPEKHSLLQQIRHELENIATSNSDKVARTARSHGPSHTSKNNTKHSLRNFRIRNTPRLRPKTRTLAPREAGKTSGNNAAIPIGTSDAKDAADLRINQQNNLTWCSSSSTQASGADQPHATGADQTKNLHK
jgi:hypothetical protein